MALLMILHYLLASICKINDNALSLIFFINGQWSDLHIAEIERKLNRK